MRHDRYYYVDEIYKSKKNWYKKKLGKLAEKEVKKQIEVLLMYEYYHISPDHYIDKKTNHWTVKYRTLEEAAKRVKNMLSMKLFTPNRFGGFGEHPHYSWVKEWYETHKHLLKLQ